MTRKILFSLLAANASLLAAPVQTPAPDCKTFTYKTVDGKPLGLDVYQPPGRGTNITPTVPAIILIHGGGWVFGKKEGFVDECKYFANRGIVAISIDYRYLDKKAEGFKGSPAICLVDTKSAIRWARSHAAELGIDPQRIILCGGSAGGHLATMAQLDTAINDPQDDLSIPTTGVALVLFNPAYQVAGQPIGNALVIDPKLEPFPYVSAKVPPMIMFFGSDDALKGPGELFLKDCMALGVKGQLWVAPGQKHGFFNGPKWMPATLVQSDQFLTGLGLLPASATPPAAESKLVPEIK